jgi:hypothetical protein
MPLLNRIMSKWRWFVIFDTVVSLGLVAGSTFAQPTLPAAEIGGVQSRPEANYVAGSPVRVEHDEHGGQIWAYALPGVEDQEIMPPRSEEASVSRPGSQVRSFPASRSTSFLNEPQIWIIKSRLNLMPHQERYWPAVEVALRRIAFRKTPEGARVLDSDSVQRLYLAAGELVRSLNASQLGEVQRLARLVGLKN